jgi:large subunit ribosomal protein L16
MLMPKRTKYRKMMKGRNRGYARSGYKITFGDIALKAVEAGRINSRQIEAARITSTRAINRQGKIWIRVFPAKPLTKRPLEVRMGKGKGPIDQYVMNIKPGRIIFEMAGVDKELAIKALTLAMHKLPFKTKIITAEMSNEIF